MTQKHVYNENKEFSNDPEDCDHEETQTVVDNIGEVVEGNGSFEECLGCGARVDGEDNLQ